MRNLLLHLKAVEVVRGNLLGMSRAVLPLNQELTRRLKFVLGHC